MKEGHLIQNGVHLHEHEFQTVKVLLDNGYDVELITPSLIEGVKTPDIMLQGVQWEMKSPSGKGRRTIQNIMQTASCQSANIIIDLQRSKLPEQAAIKDVERQFRYSKRIKRVKIITTSREILSYSK